MGNIYISDDDKTKMRELYKQHRSAAKVAYVSGFNVKSVLKYCHDIIVESRQLDYQWVITARRRLREDRYLSIVDLAKELGVGETTLRRAVRGDQYKAADAIEPPIDLVARSDYHKDNRIKARELYDAKMPFEKIVEHLGVATSSVSLWCRDLIEARRAAQGTAVIADEHVTEKNREKRLKAIHLYKTTSMSLTQIADAVGVNKGTSNNWCRHIDRDKKTRVILERPVAPVRHERKRSLSDDQVIAMRNEIREKRLKRIRYYADLYKVTMSVIQLAITGQTYQTLNEISPPILEHLRPINVKKQGVRHYLPLLVQTVKDSHRPWTYKEMAIWMKEQSGRDYKGRNLSFMIKRHAPELIDMNLAIMSPIEPRAPKPKKVRVCRPKTPKVKTFKIETRQEREERLSLMRAIARENRYEKEVAAGLHPHVAR